MPKDIKLGMILGVIVVTTAVVWLSTRKELSIEARLEQSNSGSAQIIEPGLSYSAKQTTTGNQNRSEHREFGQVKTENTKRSHVVHQGDTLSSIALKYYGSTKSIEKIRNANSNVIRKNDLIIPGMRLVLPD